MNRPALKFGVQSSVLFLSLSIGLSNSALALRNQQQEDPSQLSGLEEALKNPVEDLHRFVQRVGHLGTSPGTTYLTSTDFAGLEEPSAENRYFEEWRSFFDSLRRGSSYLPIGHNLAQEGVRHVVFSYPYALNTGGAPAFQRNVIEALLRSNGDLTIELLYLNFSQDPSQLVLDDPVKGNKLILHGIPGRGKNGEELAKPELATLAKDELQRIHGTKKVDLLAINNSTPQFEMSNGLLELAEEKGIPAHVYFHGGLFTEGVRYLMQRSDAATVNSAAFQGVLENFGVHADVIHPVADISFFTNPPGHEDRVAVERLRQQYGLGEKKVILHSSIVRALKGQRDTIRAAGEFRRRYPELWDQVIFVIAGPDRRADQPGEEREILRRMAEREEVEVVFAGEQSRQQMRWWYQTAYLVLYPTRGEEPFGLVSVEAQASGVPVIVTNVGGLPETLVESQTGMVIQRGDYRGLARAIHSLVVDEKESKRMGDAAARHIRERYAPEKTVREFTDSYLKAVYKIRNADSAKIDRVALPADPHKVLFDLYASAPLPRPDVSRLSDVDLVQQWKRAWLALLEQSRPYWRAQAGFPFPYNKNALAVAYDPRLIPQKAVRPYLQLNMPSMPDREERSVSRLHPSVPMGGSHILDEVDDRALFLDPSNENFVVLINRYPKVIYDSLLVSRHWQRQRLTREAVRAEIEWAQRGVVAEFHHPERFLDHLHIHLYSPDTIPVARFVDSFVSSDQWRAVDIGKTAYPPRHIALASSNLRALEEATLLLADLLEEENHRFSQTVLPPSPRGQWLVLFHLLKPGPQEVGFSPVGFLKVGSTTLDDTTLIRKAEEGFLGEETLQQVRRIFWSRWMERKTAGLEESERLGDLVDTNRVKMILPAVEAPDFSKGAFLSIDAGMARRFRRSVEAAIARGELPEGFERNKLLVELKGKPAGVWPKLAAKDLGLAVVSVVGEDRERVMDAYQREIPGIAFVAQAKPDGTPWPGGTGHAVYFGMQMPRIREAPFVVISAGDQPLYNAEVFKQLITAYQEGRRLDPSVDLVMAHAVFEDPTNKGRVVEDSQGNVLGILEQAAVDAMPEDASWNGYTKKQLLAIPKGNVSIYVIDPELLLQLLPEVRNNPPTQKEFYLTDIVGLLVGEFGQKLLGRKGNVISIEIPVERAPDLTEFQHFRQVEGTLSRLSSLEEIIQGLDQVLQGGGDVAAWLQDRLSDGTIDRFLPEEFSIAEFRSLPKEVLDRLSKQSQTALSLPESWRLYGHPIHFDHQTGPQHTMADLAALRRIVQFDPKNQQLLDELKERGERRTYRREGKTLDGISFQQGARYQVERGGLLNAVMSYQRLHAIYAQLGSKRILWLGSLLHDMAKPLFAPRHDEIMAEFVETRKILSGISLSDSERRLLSEMIRYHQAIGVPTIREWNRTAALQDLYDAATKNFDSPEEQQEFADLLILMTVADVDAIGTYGMHTSTKLSFQLDFYDELSHSLETHQQPQSNPTTDSAWGMERLRSWTEPFPDSPHGATTFQSEVDRFYPEEASREIFYQQLGSIWRFTYSYELLRAMENPQAVVRLLTRIIEATNGIDRSRLRVDFASSLNSNAFKADPGPLNALVLTGIWDATARRLVGDLGSTIMTLGQDRTTGRPTLTIEYQPKLTAAGLEEREVAVARDLAVVALGKVFPPLTLVESRVLIFTNPETFDLVPLAVRWGRTVGVDYDGPEADAVQNLLNRLPLPKGAYAIGKKATEMLLKESENPVWIASREDALRRLGLNPDDLPPVVREAIEITQDYLGQFV